MTHKLQQSANFTATQKPITKTRAYILISLMVASPFWPAAACM